jgi:hypothetical protein
MELVEAVKKQDVEKVKVRRPLEAGSSTESGPWRGVSLGLGQWTLDAVVACPIRPCWVESSPCVIHHSGNSDAACRRSSLPVRTSSSVTRTLPCRLAESLNFSPPPSPAIAVSRDFLKFAAFYGCASGVRDGDYSESSREYSLPLTVTQNEHLVDPRGEPAVLFSGTGWVLRYPRGAHPRTRPRRAQQWQHRAALCGLVRQSPNRRIARRCQRRHERPERQRVRRLRSRRIGR